MDTMDTLDNLGKGLGEALKDGVTVKDGNLQLDKVISDPGAGAAATTSTASTVMASSPVASNFKTCEEYVLASLEAYKKKAALVDSYAATFATLKEIFFVVSTPTGINIGVHDERLDIEHDSTAIARVMLLKTLFETTAVPQDSQDEEREGNKDLDQYSEYTTESVEEAEALNIAEAYKGALYNKEETELDLDTTAATADVSPAATPQTLQGEELDLDNRS